MISAGSVQVKVSIITVCLNNASTIEQTIESVIRQEYSPIEYVLVDGGSKDGTIDIICKYKDKISRLISEPDNGVYDAMNKGLKVATGEIVAFLNADDFYADESVVSEIVSHLSKNSLDAAYGDLLYVRRTNAERIVRFWKPGAYKRGAALRGWAIPHPTFFCRRGIFEKYGHFNEELKIAADFELILRLIEKHRIRVGYLPKVLVKMRTGGKANSLKGIMRGNLEIIRSFKLNGLKLSPLFFLTKPVNKAFQLFCRPKLYK